MRYSTKGTNVFTTVTKYYATVWVNHGFLLAVFFFCSEGFGVAEVYTFSAGCAFCVIYYWVPRDFVSRDSFVVGFGHVWFHLKKMSL